MNHYAKLETSPRLQKLYGFLQERGTVGATSMEIVAHCAIVNPGCSVSELAKNGIIIECKPDGVTEGGQRKFRYTFVKDTRKVKVAA